MTTAAKRASKKANRAKKQARVAKITEAAEAIFRDEKPVITESDHARVMAALAATKRFAKKVRKDA